MRGPLLALVTLALAGCGALNDYQTAATLPAGGTEVGFEVSGFAVTSDEGIGGIPGGAVVSRHGLTDGFELGLRLGTMGAEVTGKWLLLDDAVRLAIAPTLGGFALGGDAWWAGLRAPLLIEVPFGEHGLVFSPRVQAQAVQIDSDLFGSDGVAVLLNAGAGVGFALALGPVVLMPEISVVYPFAARNADGESASDAPLLVQGGVGLRWRFGS